jgi:pimeloyl-ACP methyl ester carboxylesterase
VAATVQASGTGIGFADCLQAGICLRHGDLDGHRRWYSVQGDLAADGAPLVVCHGGPGSPHDYLENVPALLGERAVVL